MKKALLSLFLICVVALSVNAQECESEILGAAPSPVPPTDQAGTDGSDTDCMIVQEWNNPGTFSDYNVVVTEPDSSFIVGVSIDGAFDFSGFSEGDYTFTAFAFNQADFDQLAEDINPLLPLLSYPPIPLPATLDNVFNTLGDVLGDITVPDVEDAICNFLPTVAPDAEITYSVSEAPYVLSVAAGNNACDGVGIDDIALTTNVTLAPVPAVDFINVGIESNDYALTVSIYNVNGQLVNQKVTADRNVTFNIADLSSGMYFVEVSNGIDAITEKFVK